VQMKTRVAGVLVASAAAVAMMGAPAFASPSHDGPVNNFGNVSIVSGNKVNAPVSVPINVCGNAFAILGFAEASCQGGAGVFFNSPNSGW
jgi:ChpA-C